jgi:hypothetical protein
MHPNVMPPRNRFLFVVLAVLATSMPATTDAAANAPQTRASSSHAALVARRSIEQQPATVSGDVDVDLAGSLPSSGVQLLLSGAIKTTAEVRSKPIEACPGFWFTAIGVVWNQLGSGRVVGSVSWANLARSTLGKAELTSDDDGPDSLVPTAGPGLRSTDLIWTGAGWCAWVTLDLPAGVTISNLHVAFANTSGSAAGPETGPPDLAPRPTTEGSDAADPTGRATTTQGGPPMPAMVSRASWGADPKTFNTGSPGCSAPYYSPIKVAYVHHTSGSNSYSPAQGDDIVRGIDWYHTQERGYCDIAYSFLVDRFGTPYVGRAGGSDLPVTPGSQAGFNPYTFSVSVMGNFATTNPPAAAIGAVERVLAWKLDVAHVPADGTATLVSQGFDTDRYAVGERITMHTIEGHRRTSQTDCPGRIWDVLPQIRRTVAAMGGAKIYRPEQGSTRVQPGGQPVQLTATANQPLRWTVSIERQNGQTIRPLQLPGRSMSLHASWDGLDANGDPAPPGKYLAVIAGSTARGQTPRSATLQVDVPGPLPGPLSVPSGTVQVSSGFPLLRAVAATGPQDVWAVGSVATTGAIKPLVRHLEPTGWHSVTAPNPGIHGSALQAVDAIAADDAWAGGFSCLSAACGPNGGFGSRTLLEHWDGHAWTAAPTPSPGTALNEIRAVDAVAPDDVWAVGLWSDRGRWLRRGLVLHWDGSSWRQVPIPFVDGETHLDGLSAVASDDAWVVGETCPGPCSGQAHSTALALHWDGTRVTRVPPAPLEADRSGFDGVLTVGPDEAWAVGGRSANRVAPTHPLAERWDGHRWRPVDTPLSGKSAHWFAITDVPGAGLWSVGGFAPGDPERPLVMRRRSTSRWTRATVPSPNVHLAFLGDVAVISKTNVWAVGPSSAGPLAVHWNGSSWTLADTAGNRAP